MEEYVSRIFNTLNATNSEACQMVQVILTDKDFVERQVIKSVLPMLRYSCVFFMSFELSTEVSQNVICPPSNATEFVPFLTRLSTLKTAVNSII